VISWICGARTSAFCATIPPLHTHSLGELMNRNHFWKAIFVHRAVSRRGAFAWAMENRARRDPKQPVDEAYTAEDEKYTTAPYFTSPLVDYLPASKTVPTPEVDSATWRARGILPYAEDVYKYMPCWKRRPARQSDFGRHDGRKAAK